MTTTLLQAKHVAKLLVGLSALLGDARAEERAPDPPAARAAAGGEPRQEPAPAAYPAVTPDRLLEEYLRNEVAADATYRGRVVEVTGEVARVRKDFADRIRVELRTWRPEGSVEIGFGDEWAAVVAGLAPGQLVTAAGTVSGMTLRSVSLRDAAMIWTGRTPAARGAEPSADARAEANVIAASFAACMPEVARRGLEEQLPALRDEVLQALAKERGTGVTPEMIAAADAVIREKRASGALWATEGAQRFLARAERVRDAGLRELARLRVDAVRCEHPSLRLAYACTARRAAKDVEHECATEEMTLAVSRYRALVKDLPPP